MAKLSIDLSDHAALEPLARLVAAFRAAAPEVSMLLVGATARDLLLAHAHGIAPERATLDTDFALAVPGWDVLLRLREALVSSGRFVPEPPFHRLRFGDQRLDIIPFGGVERPDRSIAWPPAGAEVLDVHGLREALATAVSVRLPGDQTLEVASLPALALLKVWAWKDRRYTTPGKDASDLWILLRHYVDAGNQDRLYGSEGRAALTFYGFDVEIAGGWLLGMDARAVVHRGPDPESSLATLEGVLSPEIDPDGPLGLVGQMPPGDRERQMSLLTAFCAGLFASPLT